MTRLISLRLDVAYFVSAERMPLPERCSAALKLQDPLGVFSEWNPRAFASLTSLCIGWGAEAFGNFLPRESLTHLFAALPGTVERLDIMCTYPTGCSVVEYMTLPQTLKALRLRCDGSALRLRMHPGVQRLMLQFSRGQVVLDNPASAFQSLTDMHVEAATLDLGQHLGEIVQEKGQLSMRVPDKSEIYGGGDGRPVRVAHLGPWPPSMPGYDGPDVPEARACCYWPCACGACESRCRAHFWRVPRG